VPTLSCPGFRFAGVAAGIKSTGARDLGLIVAEGPAHAAAVFTRNQVAAAPVIVSRAALARSRGLVRAVVVNSGNANACTGAQGLVAARAMVAATAAAAAAPRREVLVASTGIIGHRLPMPAVRAGIAAAGRSLAPDLAPFADAILTTDRCSKTARRRARLGGTPVRLVGCTKGAGMIAPNMATTLTFVCTDAAVPVATLRGSLAGAVAATFNALTIDGDTSTNDMLLVLASGAARNPRMTAADRRTFARALTAVLDHLAVQLMRGGEGVHHVVTVRVVGARSHAAAATVARSIAPSPLVKTAIAGRDPNWGRVIHAVGYSGARIREEMVDIYFDGRCAAKHGLATDTPITELQRAVSRPKFRLCIDLNLGSGEYNIYTSDLSPEYVVFNREEYALTKQKASS